MKIPDYMVGDLKELKKLNEESRRLGDLAFPDVAERYRSIRNMEMNLETIVGIALSHYKEKLEEDIIRYKNRIEENQKNNSCDNTSQ